MPRLNVYRVSTEYGATTVEARSRSSARYKAWHESGASECTEYMHFARCVRSIHKLAEIPKRPGVVEAEVWNATNPVGTRVRYWTGLREGPGVESSTRSEALALSPEHASVWVDGHTSCIALSHVEVVR